MIDADLYYGLGRLSTADEYNTSTATGYPASSRSTCTRYDGNDRTAISQSGTPPAESIAFSDTSRIAPLDHQQIYASSKDSAETVRHHFEDSENAGADTGSPAYSEVIPELVPIPGSSDGTGGSDTSSESARSVSAGSPTPSSASSTSSVSEDADEPPLPSALALDIQRSDSAARREPNARTSGDAMSRVADWAAREPSSPSVPDTDSEAPISPIAAESSLPGACPLNSSFDNPATDDTYLNFDGDDARSEGHSKEDRLRGPYTVDATGVPAYGDTTVIDETDGTDGTEGTDVSDTSAAIGESYVHRVYHLSKPKQPSDTRLSDDLASINFGDTPHLAPFEISVQPDASDTADPHDSAAFDAYSHGADDTDGDANGSSAIIQEPATYARYRLPGAPDTGGYTPVGGTAAAAPDPEADNGKWDSNVASPTGTGLSGGTDFDGINCNLGASDGSKGTVPAVDGTADPAGSDIDWGWGKPVATDSDIAARPGPDDSRMDIDWDWDPAAFVKRAGSFIEATSVQRDSRTSEADSSRRAQSASRWSTLRSRAKDLLTAGRSSMSSYRSNWRTTGHGDNDGDTASVRSSIKSAFSSCPAVSASTGGLNNRGSRTGRTANEPDTGWLSRIRGGVISEAGSSHDIGSVLGAGKHKSRGIHALLGDRRQGQSTRIRIATHDIQAPGDSLMTAGGRWG